MFDRSHLARKVGGADDVDAREGQQEDVRRLHEPTSDLTLQGLDFQGFPLTILVQRERDAPVLVGGDSARRRLGSPVEDGLDGALLETDAGLTQGLTYYCQSSGLELRGRGIVAEQVPGDQALPELVEAGGVAGQRRFEMVADLAVEGSAFFDQVAAMTDQELQHRPG